jgi:hypothetical protein
MIYRGPSCRLRLHAHPNPPLFRQKPVSLSKFKCVSPVQLTDGGGVVVEPDLIVAIKCGPL